MNQSIILCWSTAAALLFISLFNGSDSYPGAVGNHKTYLMLPGGDITDRWSDNRFGNIKDTTNDPYMLYENNDLELIDPLVQYLERNKKKWCPEKHQYYLDEPSTRENIQKIFSNENFKRTPPTSGIPRGNRNPYVIDHGNTTQSNPKADKKYSNAPYNDHLESVLSNQDFNDIVQSVAIDLLGKVYGDRNAKENAE